jgi:TonB-linked outer membrane protein, SusC/RagA family
MKKIKSATLLFIALFSCSIVFAQQKSILRGRVIDKSDRSPILGANVLEYDKDNRVVNGAVCNATGDFVLEIKDLKNVIRVSFIGYKATEIKPNFAGNMIIELESASNILTEVEVTAQRKGRSLTNLDDRDKATSSVKTDLKDLKESGVLSVTDALQGKVSGLDILGASGDPGSGSRIVIRGLSSLGNSKPLVVIDGIPQSKFDSYAAAGNVNLSSANAEDIGTVLSIPINDIKSIEVLKDAASTAQYGSKGADGVLLIETNKGQKGKVQVEYSYKRNMNFERKPVPLLNGDEYIMLQREELHNARGFYDLQSTEFRPIAYDKSFDDYYNYSQNTDWLAAITQNSVSNENFVKVSGGGEKAKYYTSISYTSENGTTINTSNDMFSSRMNLDYFLSKKLWFNINFNYVNTNNNRSLDHWSGWINRDLRDMAYIKAPNMSIYEYDKYGNLTGDFYTPVNNYQAAGSDYYNPVAVAKLGKNELVKNSLENDFSVSYSLTSWLTFIETASLQIAGSKQNMFLPYNALGLALTDWRTNLEGEQNQIDQSFKTQTQLSYNIPFANTKHSLSGIATWNTDQTRQEWMQIQKNRLPSVQLQDGSIYGMINWEGAAITETKFLEGVFSANYKYNDRYLFQLTMTEDAHSAFGSNHLWGTFYGIGSAWRFGKEEFIKNLKIFGSESKFRLDYGKSGRQPDKPYARFATYASFNPSSYLGYSNIVPQQPELSNLRWESTYGTNIGLDLYMFNDRLTLNAEVYFKKTKDLMQKPYYIPHSSGFDQLTFFNGGVLDNKGWEVMGDYFIIKKPGFTIDISFNFSRNQNIFSKFAPNFPNENSTTINNGEYPRVAVEGRPLGSFYGFKYLGVYSTDADAVAKDASGNVIKDNSGAPIPMNYNGTYIFRGGDAKYEDINHDGKIDKNDLVYLGNAYPKYYGGFGPSIKYKGISFRCDFQFRTGFDIVNMTALNTQGMSDKNNQSKAVLRRWRAQGQNEPNMLPRAYYGSPANNLGSDRYVEKGDFLRLLNIQLGYSLPTKYCEKIHVSKVNFTVSARRFAVWTGYTGVDPEISANAADPFWMGADNSNTPQPKVLSFALTVGL